jgi:hypothetical protein
MRSYLNDNNLSEGLQNITIGRCRLLVLISIRTMPAATFAAIASLEVIGFGKNHEAIFPVE